MSRLAPGRAIFFVLLVATLVTAVLVVRARSPDLVLEVTAGLPATFEPSAEGARDFEITFFVRQADPAARVAIVDSHEEVVRTLDPRVALEAGEEVTYAWDGRTDAGRLARGGRYRLLVELPSRDRSMVWPRRLTLEPGAREARRGKERG